MLSGFQTGNLATASMESSRSLEIPAKSAALSPPPSVALSMAALAFAVTRSISAEPAALLLLLSFPPMNPGSFSTGVAEGTDASLSLCMCCCSW